MEFSYKKDKGKGHQGLDGLQKSCWTEMGPIKSAMMWWIYLVVKPVVS
jgi:hypothetical protein